MAPHFARVDEPSPEAAEAARAAGCSSEDSGGVAVIPELEAASDRERQQRHFIFGPQPARRKRSAAPVLRGGRIIGDAQPPCRLV